MKTIPSSLLIAAGFASALIAQAGPPSDFFARMQPKKQTVTAPAPAPTMPDCAGCKSESIRQTVFRGPPHRSHVESVVVGLRHECSACTGVIVVRQGKVIRDTMQRAPACAEPAKACCAALAMND